MVTTCHAAGVKVIAGQSKSDDLAGLIDVADGLGPDTIWNHMTAQNSGIGVAGSSS